MKKPVSVAALAVLVIAILMAPSIDAGSSTNMGAANIKMVSSPSNYGLPQENTLFDTFTQEVLVTGSIASVAIGDLNNDGRPDIAVGYSNANGVDVYFQSGLGFFPGVPSKSIPTSNHILALTCGDYDGDSLVDLVIGNGSRIDGYRQSDGFGQRIYLDGLITSYLIHDIVARDFDKDGKIDFAVLATTDNPDSERALLSVLYNSDYFYSSDMVIPNMTRPRSIAVGDFNNNGFDDIVIADEGKNIVAGYLNVNNAMKDWNPTFQISSGLLKPTDLFVNNTGGLGNRLVVASRGTDQIRLYQYSGASKTFGLNASISMAGLVHLAAIDFDKNNRMDFAAISNSSNNASIFLSPSYPSQYGIPTTSFPCLDSPIHASATDFNGDGKQDLVISSGVKSGKSAIVIYYRTDSTMSNANDNVIINGRNPDSITFGGYDGTGIKTIATLNKSSHTITFSDSDMNLLDSLTVANSLLTITTDNLRQTDYDDLVTLEQNGKNVTVYWGNGNFYSGSNPYVTIMTGLSSPRSIATGDLTGGPGKEILVGLANGIEVLKNSGTSPYFNSGSNYILSLPNTDVSSLAIGDFDAGFESDHGYHSTNDIALVNETHNSIQIYYNTGDVSTPFVSGTGVHRWVRIDLSTYSTILWLTAGDVNGDGMKDLIAGLSDGKVLVFPQQRLLPDGFDVSVKMTIQIPLGADRGTVGDLDDDGSQEIAVSSDVSGQISVIDHSASILRIIANKTIGAGSVIPTCSDVNGDGRTDLVAAATGSFSISFYYQNNLRPFARITTPVPASPFEGDQVKFDGSTSSDGLSDMNALNYTWTFDNQTTRWGKLVYHSFILNKTHDYSLMVRDQGGLTDIAYGRISVKDILPVANYNYSPTFPVEGHPIHFYDMSISNSNTINGWLWDFGDGTTSADRDPIHTYNFSRTYNVQLKITEIDGSTSEHTDQVIVSDRDPVASFRATENGFENSTVWFNDSSNPWSDHIESWTWNFGDGSNIVNIRNTAHIYAQNGMYQVTLTVIDNRSRENTTIQTVTILDRVPIVGFDVPTGKYENETDWVNFSDNSSSLYPDGDPIVYWEWEFYDGSKNISRNASHKFPQSGIYSVTLRIRDLDDSNTVELTKQIHVLDLSPTAAITRINGVWYENNNTIHFTDASTSYRLDPIVHWTWDFGDGSGSSERNPSHSFLWQGTYSVRLTVEDSDGAISSPDSISITIHHTIPSASIGVVTPKPYVVGDMITFQDTSSAAPDTIVAWLWESDAESSSQPTFKHQFNANSNFRVKLTVWTNASVWSSATISINLEPSNVSISTADGMTTHVEDTSVTFVVAATRSPTDPIVNYTWDFSFGPSFVANDVSTSNTFTWHFNQSGSYLVKVRVYDTNGYTEVSRQITVLESDPTPAFTCGNLNSGGPVWFNANQTHDTPSDEPTLRFRWNFGDSSPWSDWNSSATTSHTYPRDGNYTVIMQVKDDSGKIIPLSRSVVVDRSPPKIEISSPISKAYIGDPIFVYANVTDLIGVEQVVLIYTIGNQTFTVPMTPVNQAGSYVAEIPAQNRSVNITYAISAVDVSGMRSPLSQSFQIILSQRPANDMMWAAIALLMSSVMIMLVYAFVTRPVVDEVFVIYHDGSLLSHDTRHLKPGMDDQILSSMLIALQSFVKDSFKDETLTELKRMEFGEKRILVEREGPVFLAVILRGKRDGKATREMKYSLDGINHRFGGMLNPWDGDLEKVRGVKDMVKPLVKRKGLFREK